MLYLNSPNSLEIQNMHKNKNSTIIWSLIDLNDIEFELRKENKVLTLFFAHNSMSNKQTGIFGLIKSVFQMKQWKFTWFVFMIENTAFTTVSLYCEYIATETCCHEQVVYLNTNSVSGQVQSVNIPTF